MRLPALRSRRRSAFTLIELLTVIAIIAILVALAAGAYFRLSSSQYIKRTEATMKSVQTGFDAQWKAGIDIGKEDIKNGKVNMAAFASQGVTDPDAAKALYLKMRMMIEFPQTFNEANNPGLSAFGSLLQPKAAYTSAISGATATGVPEESAVLLYLALTQSRRGTAFNIDEAGSGAVKTITVGGKQFSVLVDGWGTPITFQRFNTMDPNLVVEMTTAAAGDPFDQYGKLKNLPTATKTPFEIALSDQIDGFYHGPVLRSAGPDRNVFTNDDIIGFRLMKEGQKGN